MDVSLTQQIKEVQQKLRQQAQLLGQLNLKNFDYLQQNQQLALAIVQLRNKIAKKKHTIQQENKDKMIIHEKLIKAEREKQLLEIQKHRKQQENVRKNHEREELERVRREMNAVNLQQQMHIDEVSKELAIQGKNLVTQHLPDIKQQPKSQQNHQHQKPVITSPFQQQKHTSSKSQSNNQHYAEQSDRGEYQPPILFMETENTSEKSKSQDSSDEDMDEEMLAKLKSAAEDQDQNDQDD